MSKTKQRGRPKGVLYAQPLLYLVSKMQEGELYTNIGVGLSALLVSTYWAMRRPLDRGTSDRLAPRFFVYMCNHEK